MLNPTNSLDKSTSGIVELRGRNSTMCAGRGLPVLVNVSIGLTKAINSSIAVEQQKIREVLQHEHRPDLMMDLSIVQSTPEPWEVLQEEFGGPVGVLPHYLCFDENTGLRESQIMSRIENLIQKGIAFITIHASPTISLFQAALATRIIPIGSRGGSIVIKDMLLNNRKESIYYKIFDSVAEMAAKNRVVINLGTTFRAASVADGLDGVATQELHRQVELVNRARMVGAQVVLEGPGHLLLSEVDKYIALTQQMNVPLMPLGPIVTDSFPGFDHYVNLIGSAYMMSRCQGGIINAITSMEHRGGSPTAQLIIEALDAARVAAHAATVSYHEESRSIDRITTRNRAIAESCVVSVDAPFPIGQAGVSSGCDRCGHLCPLIKDAY